jgi:DNA-binding NarL/FixJ family response regulator
LAKTILVVADRPDIREQVESMLRLPGYSVLAGDDAGLRQHLHEPEIELSLVLADSAVLDVSDGMWDFRRTHPDLPIVILSSNPSSPRVAEISRSYGASLVAMPFTQKRLNAVVREALERLPAPTPGYSLVVAGRNRKWPALDRLLASDSGISVLRCPGAPKDISSFCQKLSPCVVVLDSTLAFTLTPDWVRSLTQSGSVQVLAHFWERPPEECEVERCLRVGCAGVLDPGVSAAVLKKAALAALSGEFWASRRITSRMLKELLGERTRQITGREAEILQMVAEGRKNREIAEQLFISVQTVRWHLRSAYSKLGITGRHEVALHSARLGDKQVLRADGGSA